MTGAEWFSLMLFTSGWLSVLVFGRRGKIKSLQREVARLKQDLAFAENMRGVTEEQCVRAIAAATEWKQLAMRFQRQGGNKAVTQLSADDIKRLLLLCHPDKHGGKESAVQMTQKLLSLRGR